MPLALHSSNLGATGGSIFSLQGCAIGCHVDEALDATRRICIVTILMRVQISICGFSGLFVIPILCLDPKVSISDVPRKY